MPTQSRGHGTRIEDRSRSSPSAWARRRRLPAEDGEPTGRCGRRRSSATASPPGPPCLRAPSLAASSPPMTAPPVTIELLKRGRERFDTHCAMCHDRTGEGDGMIVRRGYAKPLVVPRSNGLARRATSYILKTSSRVTATERCRTTQARSLTGRIAGPSSAYVRALERAGTVTLADEVANADARKKPWRPSRSEAPPPAGTGSKGTLRIAGLIAAAVRRASGLSSRIPCSSSALTCSPTSSAWASRSGRWRSFCSITSPAATGAWSSRGTLESVLATLPALAVLFVPLAPRSREAVSVGRPGRSSRARSHGAAPAQEPLSECVLVLPDPGRDLLRHLARRRLDSPEPSPRPAQARGWSVPRHERTRAFAGPMLALYGLTVTFSGHRLDHVAGAALVLEHLRRSLIAVGWLLPGMAFAVHLCC